MQAKTRKADPGFKYKLAGQYSNSLKYCYQCGTCTAACPIAKFIGIYRPSTILELAKLGVRGLPQSSAFLFCSACTLCTRHCPQGVKVHEIMQGLKELAPEDPDVRAFLYDGFGDAVAALGENMPFPVSYSWICLRPKEDDHIMINVLEEEIAKPAAKTQANGKPVAVVGSGPAGLTAAWALAKAGLRVTVYESNPVAGGMLKAGIPEYRLPKRVVDAEIEKIKAAGVDIQVNTTVDSAFFGELLEHNAAVFIASGAVKSRGLRVPGETLKGVVPALEFLKAYNLNGKAQVGKNVVVIGGGNVAMDAAGAALRCVTSRGEAPESVKLFCLEDRSTMPAHAWEIDEAAADGVEIHPSWGVSEILGENGAVAGVEFMQCSSVFDSNGRFNPVLNGRNALKVEADMVITAIGQAPDLDYLSGEVSKFRGTVDADPYTFETSVPGVYAGGDASGAASLAEAIFTGKSAAEAILRYLEVNE